ncbi:MAG: hypothetical protein M1484_04415 [Patescibacteria group bacterium]|nr:hypothetical protein [Patescibacteria group bacterium]
MINFWTSDLLRQTVLFVIVGLGMLVFLVRSLRQKTVFVRTIFDAPLVLFVTVSLISAIFSTNRPAALAADPVVYATAAVLFSLIVQAASSGRHLVIASRLTLLFGLVLTGVSAISSMLSAAILAALLFPLALGFFRRDWTFKILTVATLGALGASLYELYKNRPVLLPIDAGWKTATGVLSQTPLGPLLGVGPGNFVDAFTAYKPASLNSLPIWNLRFTVSSNFYFYLLSTVGLLGLGAFLLLVFKLVRAANRRLSSGVTGSQEKGIIASLAAALILFLFLPAPAVAIIAFAAILALFIVNLRVSGNATFVSDDPRLLSSIGQKQFALVIALVILAASTFFLGKDVLADYYFQQSLVAAAANAGTQTYNLQIKAIQLNPDNDAYQLTYSQTNLALANALASQPNLSDEQKQTVLTLVQQSIQAGRNGVTLAPNRAADWENLALIYRNLINFAQGADQFAIASENQAVSLDPTNPRLRLDLGGIYFLLKDYQSAGQIFAQAVNLKDDYANAHYNLAQAEKELKLTDQAKIQLKQAANLICADPNSADCQKVTAEITGLNAPAPAPVATPSALSNAKTEPPAVIASPSGQIQP